MTTVLAVHCAPPDVSPTDISSSDAYPPTTAAQWLAGLAVAALIDEAELTPKPALVDRRGSGAHVDLNLPLMRRSAHSLRAGFVSMAQAAAGRTLDLGLRERLGAIGRDAERTMLKATDGSNAHRGAIWILGLLLASASMQDADAVDEHALASTAAAIACLPDAYAPITSSHGRRVQARYGATGARGEALGGFPHLFGVGLPALRRARARGESETVARLNALIEIVHCLEDTCLLHRGGREALMTAQRGARRVIAAGGVATQAGFDALWQLDADLLARNASPGGAADLLAATLFVDRLIDGNVVHNVVHNVDGSVDRRIDSSADRCVDTGAAPAVADNVAHIQSDPSRVAGPVLEESGNGNA